VSRFFEFDESDVNYMLLNKFCHKVGGARASGLTNLAFEVSWWEQRALCYPLVDMPVNSCAWHAARQPGSGKAKDGVTCLC